MRKKMKKCDNGSPAELTGLPGLSADRQAEQTGKKDHASIRKVQK